MTLQQIEYLIAIDKYKNFTTAAEICGVTQPTLSAMVQKLELELDIIIFDRKKQPIVATNIGKKIIEQSYIALNSCNEIVEIVNTEKTGAQGTIRMAILPTIAPYIVPKYLAKMREISPLLDIQISEAKTTEILSKLRREEIDIALLVTPLNLVQFLEIPVYYEKFVAYVSPLEPMYKQDKIESSKMPLENMWLLQEGHCFRGQILNFCNQAHALSNTYKGGNIDTLVSIVDNNGGYTILPELHLDLLPKQCKKNVRELVEPNVVREISLVVRQDFVKEKKLNIVADVIKMIVPESMIDSRLKRFAIHL
ncbi:MAG: LysR substrate-binding domain-containing protein [Bacteroidales bacterium]